MSKNSHSDTIKNILILVIFTAICVGCYFLWGVVSPFLVSLVVAYILNPLVSFVENIRVIKLFSFLKKFSWSKNWVSEHEEIKIPKALAVVIVFVACLLLFVIVVVPVVSSIGHDSRFLIEKIQQIDIKKILTVEGKVASESFELANDSLAPMLASDTSSIDYVNIKGAVQTASLTESLAPLSSEALASSSVEASASESERIWIFDLNSIIKRYPEVNDFIEQWQGIFPKDEIVGHLVNAVSFVKDGVVQACSGLLAFFAGAVSGMVNMILVPVLVFYILLDLDNIFDGFKALIPPEYRARVLRVCGEIDVQMGKMLRGMLISNTVFAVLMTLGLGLCRMKFFVSLGILAGIANFVPYLGGLFTAVLSVVVAAMMQLGFEGFIVKIIGISITIVVIQSIDGWYLQPYVVGGGVGLSPLVIMLALAVAGAVGGIPGMVLAVPAALICKIVGKELYHDLYDRS